MDFFVCFAKLNTSGISTTTPASKNTFVPITSPVSPSANALGVNLGTMIMVGVPTALICMLVSGIIWGNLVGNKIFTELPANVEEIKDDGKELPPFGLVLGVILIPLVLILLSTVSKYMPIPAGIQSFLGFIGKPFLALTIATLAAMYFLGILKHPSDHSAAGDDQKDHSNRSGAGRDTDPACSDPSQYCI